MKAFVPGFILVALVLSSCDSAKHDLVSDVPLGSELSKLDQYLERAAGSSGEVTEWIPATNAPSNPSDLIENEFGTFTRKSLGSYDGWMASPETRNTFTGEILFFHHGSTSSDVNSVIYQNGKLRKKDWGFLPG